MNSSDNHWPYCPHTFKTNIFGYFRGEMWRISLPVWSTDVTSHDWTLKKLIDLVGSLISSAVFFFFFFFKGDIQHPVYFTTLDFLVEYITNNFLFYVWTFSRKVKVELPISRCDSSISPIEGSIYKPSDTVHHLCPQTNNVFLLPDLQHSQTYGQISLHWMNSREFCFQFLLQ